jgi:hypothetical protein
MSGWKSTNDRWAGVGVPGIYGVICKKAASGEKCAETLYRMGGMLYHQDWYSRNEVVGDVYGFGDISVQKRLPIQKVSRAGKEYLLMADGYVYQAGGRKIGPWEKDLVGISEDILAALENPEGGALVRIRGNYTIAVYCITDGTFTLFNDIFGPRRLYYADLPEFFVFSPEIKGISFLPDFRKELDWKGISDFLNFGYVLGDDTFFTSIRSLSSASVLRFDRTSGSPKIRKYWRPAYVDDDRPIDKISDRIFDLLSESIREKVEPGDKVISPISGGLDSRVILATLRTVGSAKTVKPVTFGQKESFEYRNAKRVCMSLGLPGHTLVEIFPELLIDRYQQALWLSEGHVAMNNCLLLLIPVAITGEYSSLLNGIYGGPTNYSAEYFREDHIEANPGLEEKTEDILKVISLSPSAYQGVFEDSRLGVILKNRTESIRNGLEAHLDVSGRFCDQRDAFFIENRMRRFINQGAFYRFFWEEQLPLSHYEMYMHYLTIPPRAKLHRQLLKRMIMRKFPEIGRIPDANTGLALDKTHTITSQYRKNIMRNMKYYVTRFSKGRLGFPDRTGYAHHELWFRTHRETNRKIREILSAPCVKESGLFRDDYFTEYIDNVESASRPYEPLIRAATLAGWLRYFVEGDGVHSVRESIRTGQHRSEGGVPS